jgi:dipeptidyl aminopeptidase/acylaminoacyl peptidase
VIVAGDFGVTARTFALLAAILFGGDAVAAPAAATAPPSIQDFLAKPRADLASLSPSGRFFAYVLRGGEGDELIVVDIEKRQKRVVVHTVVTPPKHNAITLTDRFLSVTWKGDERLLYSTGADFQWTGETPETDLPAVLLGLIQQPYSLVDREGLTNVPITATSDGHVRLPRLIDSLPRDPDHILGQVGVRGGFQVHRIALADMSSTVVETSDRSVLDYVVDRNGALVGRIRKLGRTGYGWLLLEGRGPGEATWAEITQLHHADFVPLEDFELLSPAEKPGEYYVAAKPKEPGDGDTVSIRILDFKARKVGPILAQRAGYDMDDIVLDRDGKLLAGCYWADTRHCDFNDRVTGAVMAGLDKFFDGERSVTVSSISEDGRRWLLSVSGPDEPGSYYLFDRKTGQADLVADRYPLLPIDTLGHMRRFTYTARDGHALAGYVIDPPVPTRSPRPLIVMPHGGPEVRDKFAYDRWAQFLASRGYMVFQPNFRGSGGFGRAFAEAGYGQWGGLMQDDVTDGVKALIASGEVDPRRVCIVGASYGGYVALFAGATAPLYRCVVSIAGDADLVRSMQWEFAEHHENKGRVAYWTKSIGDPKTDRGRLEAKSPIRMASSFTAPVLLIHGDFDEIVSVEQSRRMRDALKASGKLVRYVELPKVGHGGWSPATETRILTELEQFLAESLPSAPATPSSQ